MNKVIAVLGAVTLLAIGAGCGSNTCQDSCQRVRSCYEGLDCSKATSAECQILKAGVGSIDCNSINDDHCAGAVQTKWDAVSKCALDPKTCGCVTP